MVRYTSSNGRPNLHVQSLGSPSCLHTTLALLSVQESSQTVPHCPPRHTSTRPSVRPPTSLTLPVEQLRGAVTRQEEGDEEERERRMSREMRRRRRRGEEERGGGEGRGGEGRGGEGRGGEGRGGEGRGGEGGGERRGEERRGKVMRR